jgi:hypothetical protein
MLPVRRNDVRRRPDVIPAEVRVPQEGSWFTGLVSNVGPTSLVLTTFRELAHETAITIVLSDAEAPIVVDGVVVDGDDGLCIMVDLVNVSRDAQRRLEELEEHAELQAVA